MNQYVVLLRGINVSGKNVLAIDALKKCLDNHGYSVEHIYLQSGNVIIRHESSDAVNLEENLTTLLSESFQMQIPCLLRTAEEWEEMIENNPYIGKRSYDADKIFATFLQQPCDPDKVITLDFKQDPSEEFEYFDKTVYLYCPNGYGRTKLTNSNFERKLKTQATTRNWKTVQLWVQAQRV
jgi:uncharacterized protein (DUF1697 family)